MVPQAFKPVLALLCVFMALMLVLKSSWYTNLSSIESLCVTVIGLGYVVLTAFVPRLAAFYRERERIHVDEWKRVGIKVVIYGIVMILMDRFGENQPDYILAAALVLFAFNVHFTAHSFGVYEDLGFSQSLITVAAVALAHVAKRGTMKIFFMICGVVLQALYDSFERWDTPPPPQEDPPPVQMQEGPIVVHVADGGPDDGWLAEERLAEEREAARLAEESEAARLAEEREAERAEAIRKRIAEGLSRRRDRITDEMTDDEIPAQQWYAEERNKQDEDIYNADGTLKEKVS